MPRDGGTSSPGSSRQPGRQTASVLQAASQQVIIIIIIMGHSASIAHPQG